MKTLFRLSLVIFLLVTSAGVCAQPSTTAPDKAYGLDPLLHNGKFYTYFLPPWTGGTQFFNGPGFVKGSVTLRGVTYDNLRLKYDVFNQQLVLQYETSSGSDNLIVLSDAWLETFNLGGVHFEILAIQDSLKRIYQVMGTAPNRLLYYWYKELAIDGGIGIENYVFSAPKRESYMLIGTKLFKYKNNKSFLALFDTEKQAALKKYFRQQHINVKKASDQVITELVNYCNTLSTK